MSKAVEALEHAAALLKETLLEKHKTRGDSWRKSLTPFTMIGLVKAKATRVDMLYTLMIGANNRKRAVDEAVEELLDIMGYCAFQVNLLTIDKHHYPMRTVEK